MVGDLPADVEEVGEFVHAVGVFVGDGAVVVGVACPGCAGMERGWRISVGVSADLPGDVSEPVGDDRQQLRLYAVPSGVGPVECGMQGGSWAGVGDDQGKIAPRQVIAA